jgi:Anti-sigma-K factor rskA, C-terminal
MTPARAPRHGDHETFDELAVGWALHALEPEDEALFARHLPDCARCARTVAETSEVMASLAADLPPADPPEDLRRRLRAEVERTEQVHRPELPADQPTELPEEPPRPARRVEPRPAMARGTAHPAGRGPGWPTAGPAGREWRRRLPVLLAAAAAAVILGLGAWNVVLNASREQAQATAQEQSHIVDSLLTPGQATIAPVSDHGGHAVATVVARHGQIQVVTWGLSENDTGATTYVVWGMRQGSPVALGTFDVMQTGMDMRTVGSDHTGLDDYSGYAISIERGRRAPATPTDIVANGQVTS